MKVQRLRAHHTCVDAVSFSDDRTCSLKAPDLSGAIFIRSTDMLVKPRSSPRTPGTHYSLSTLHVARVVSFSRSYRELSMIVWGTIYHRILNDERRLL